MHRQVTFGKQPTEAPKGAFKEIHFPNLASLDVGTQEGQMSRFVHSDGGDTRSLPRTIYFQKTQAAGHEGSVAIGAIHEMTIDGEAGVLSGKGWLVDVPDAHDAVPYIMGQGLFHNSIDMAEVKVRLEEEGDWFSDDFKVNVHFDEWKLAATTLVGKPAFADAHAVLPDEITAAMNAGPLVCEAPAHITFLATTDEEITAAATGLPSWDYFHTPEPEAHHPILPGAPDADGWIPVFGHLGLWNSCHDGELARCTVIPRPPDNYASFNKPGVLTSKGIVECGPISLYGAHDPNAEADPKNAWCDVRVIPGVHGPWVSGVVRPGVAADDVKVYAARASQISGRWRGGRLKTISAVNTPGFDVPGSGFSFSTNADGELLDLVASYAGCADPAKAEVAAQNTFAGVPAELLSMTELTPGAVKKVLSMLKPETTFTETITTTETVTTIEVEVDEELALEIEREKLRTIIDGEDDDA